MIPPGTVLVTGANKGIGLEVAKQLASRGWHVILSARNADAGEKAATSLRASGGKVEFLEMDVADEASIRRAAGKVAALDVLVNNAGIFDKDGDSSVLEVSAASVTHTFQTNTLGPLLVTRAFLPVLEKGRSPRVVNVSSGGGSLTEMSHWAPAYSISKAALNAVTRQLAAALQGRVAVNSVCPGWVRTDMGGDQAPRSLQEGADGIVWLVAEAPQSLTGQFLRDRKPIAW